MKNLQKILTTLLLAGATLACATACGPAPNDSVEHTHTYEKTVKAPTCTKIGYTIYACKCGDYYIDDRVQLLGHTVSDWIVDKEATYEEAGAQHVECTVCHEILQTKDIPILEEVIEELSYTLSKDETYYIVSGIGDCKDTDIVIPSTYNGKPVKAIGYLAFSRDKLTSVVIPDSVTMIDQMAFAMCDKLTSVVIPDSVTMINRMAFYNCDGLTSIVINGVTTIDKEAFFGCSGLTSIVIVDGVTTIGQAAFDWCKMLTIYCEAEEKPEGWDDNWNYCRKHSNGTDYCSVVWGYKPE